MALLLIIANAALANDIKYTVLPDSIDPEDEEAQERPAALNPRNTATEVNGMDYVLEGRYVAPFKDFKEERLKNVFIFGSAGIHQIMPVKGWKFIPMANITLGAGKEVYPGHTVRLGADFGLALQRVTKSKLFQFGVKAEHLFNVTNYLNGYKATRPFEVSTLLGLGVHNSYLNWKDNVVVPELHAGMQFKIFAGPYADINIEPYIGITSDKMDHSKSRNWRNFDLFYGAQITLTHYLGNRMHYGVGGDDTERSYIDAGTPWFVGTGMGINFLGTKEQDFFNTKGHEFTASLGKWFAPFYGVRGSLFMRSSNIETEETHITAKDLTYNIDRHSTYYGGRLDLMINPLGFSRNFSWNAPFGVNLLVGAEAGWQKRCYVDNQRNTKSIGITAGAQLWTRISDNVQFYVEPRYSMNINNRKWKGTYFDKRINYLSGFTVDAGINVLLRAAERERDNEGNIIKTPMPRLLVGVLGGLPMTMNYNGIYQEHRELNYDITVYGERRFDSYHGMRFSLARLALSRPALYDYYAINLNGKEISTTQEEGIWNRTFNLGLATLDYTLSLSNLFSGKAKRAVEVDAFVGTGLAFMLTQDASIYSSEPTVADGYINVYADKYKFNPNMAFDAGCKFEFHASDRLSIIAMPMVYFIHNLNMPGFSQQKFMKYRMVESLKFGLQYEF